MRFRVVSFVVAMVCAVGLLSGCADNPANGGKQTSDGAKQSDTVKTDSNPSDAPSGEANKPTYTAEQSKYLDFVKNLIDTDQLRAQYCSFRFKDINGDGKEEFLLIDATKLTVYTLNGEEVSEIDQNEFYTGTLRLLEPGDPAYPGIICFTVGGGREWHQYLTLKDGKLSLEDLWVYDYSPFVESPETREVSTDKKLIELSKTAYEKEQDVEFISVATLY